MLRGVGTPDENALPSGASWRERRTAARLVAVSRRTEFLERLGELLLAARSAVSGWPARRPGQFPNGARR
ncbi:DUF6000 family protein [Streptomyces sp. NPDC056568]|uniref:DUF6000 family protein n=1 Tax=Streptomyces sp. NPDC056568 TaxID=3345866 RepID=UPI003695EADA